MKRRGGIRARLSLAEFFYNCCFASANFLSVFLQALGFGAGQIGVVTSLTNVMNIISQPVWGVLSDRARSVRKCFVLALLLSALCVILVPALSVAGGAALLPMTALLVLLYFFLTPANMLMELWLVRVNDNPRLDISYGSVRIWASIGFALMNLAYVPLLKRLPTRSIYYFYAAFALVAAALAWRTPASTEGEVRTGRQRLRDLPFRKILNYWIVSYLLFEIAFQIPFGWRNSYLMYALNEFGIPSERLGAFLFLSGAFEVPMLLVCKRLIRRCGLAVPLLMATLLMAVEYAMYAFGSGLAALVASQLFKGLAYALYVACRHQYIFHLAPEGLGASTQAVVNAAYAGVNIVSAGFGGFILEATGTRDFFALLTAIQLGAGALFVGSHALGAWLGRERLPENLRLHGKVKAIGTYKIHRQE